MIWKKSGAPVRVGVVPVNRSASSYLVIDVAAGVEHGIGVIGGRLRGL
ncbi:hypothetical protein [Streptomyces mirabilis]|uniref:Uncharacterized protein n=1 Tax=Streptomyces mirabilis TaxID=68239 RepID=A0A1I2JFQ7_9ACTN|nr:hypothetical protein [Streptomyces mirabilis]SFF53672.1 hypothetical protein SAMN02787118_108100 [Streptomyces mirabilis]